LFRQVAASWGLHDLDYPLFLGWAARLHEVGVVISHSQYQKHGGYLLRSADLSGFTRQQQQILAALVLGHRRKFPVQEFLALPRPIQDAARRLCVLLRLAVLIHRGRTPNTKPRPRLIAEGDDLRLSFPGNWLDSHPLTRLELEQEAQALTAAGMTLEFG
jgi:exopolyphosphatase/guanosine-5'-triphosphate,3'-diphosphate pyrophosphatase